MTIIIRRKAGSREVIPKPKPKPKKKPSKNCEKTKSLRFYRKVFPNVDQRLIVKFIKSQPEALNTAMQCLMDTKQCHTNYLFYFVRAVSKHDRETLLGMPKAKRWGFVTGK